MEKKEIVEECVESIVPVDICAESVDDTTYYCDMILSVEETILLLKHFGIDVKCA